jgi:hypothetical protein
MDNDGFGRLVAPELVVAQQAKWRSWPGGMVCVEQLDDRLEHAEQPAVPVVAGNASAASRAIARQSTVSA